MYTMWRSRNLAVYAAISRCGLVFGYRKQSLPVCLKSEGLHPSQSRISYGAQELAVFLLDCFTPLFNFSRTGSTYAFLPNKDGERRKEVHMKTNKRWYFYKRQGAFFKLDHGVLLMRTDKDDVHVITPEEWYENEPMTREQMIQDLERKA